MRRGPGLCFSQVKMNSFPRSSMFTHRKKSPGRIFLCKCLNINMNTLSDPNLWSFLLERESAKIMPCSCLSSIALPQTTPRHNGFKQQSVILLINLQCRLGLVVPAHDPHLMWARERWGCWRSYFQMLAPLLSASWEGRWGLSTGGLGSFPWTAWTSLSQSDWDLSMNIPKLRK